jgi:predicted secreted Zn-dependent protease
MRWKNFVITAVATAIAAIISATWFPIPWGQLATAQNDNPKITVTKTYYTVKGNTADQVRRYMNQVGPFVEKSQRRFDGYTHWQIHWQYWYTRGDNTCRISKATVNTDVKITLPKWQPARKASPALRDRWQAYINALTIHEEGHQQNGVSASGEILSTLQAFPTYSSCEQLSQAANAASNRLIQKYAQRDAEYDRSTGHGARQGAVFP